MMRFLLFLFLTLALHAAVPKTFSSIGTPVYTAVEPTRKLSRFKTFAGDRELFLSYVEKAEKAKKEGFWLDKYRLLPEAKKRSRAYLETLRYLEKVNAQISKIVKDATLKAIRKHYVKTYFAIKKTHHPVFRSDPDLRRAAARFERRLKREKHEAEQRKKQRHAAFVRSYRNLKGRWKGKSDRGEKTLFHFKSASLLVITHTTPQKTQTIEGRWKIRGDMLEIDCTRITNRKKGDVPHSRSTRAKLTMQLKKIGTRKLVVYDTRRRKEYVLAR